MSSSRLFALAVLVTTLAGSTWCCDVKTVTVLDNACNATTLLLVTSVSQRSSAVGPGKCDLIFDKKDFAQQPTVKMANAKKDALYTLVMVDPDAPRHSPGRFYLHWILANIQGSDLVTGRLDRASLITAYVGPGPPKNTGLHRYMFAVYEQGARADDAAHDARPQFDLASWLRRKQRAQLCGPVAAAQFRAQF